MAGEGTASTELRPPARCSIRQLRLCAICGSSVHWYISTSVLHEHEGPCTTAQALEPSLHARCHLWALACHRLIRSCTGIPQSDDAWEPCFRFLALVCLGLQPFVPRALPNPGMRLPSPVLCALLHGHSHSKQSGIPSAVPAALLDRTRCRSPFNAAVRFYMWGPQAH